MIRYYSYYSEGGYKDMYLGNNGMTDVEKMYYLPLLPSKRAEAAKKNDSSFLKEVEMLESLPKIGIIDSKSSYELHYKASRYFILGCYSMLYSHLDGEKYLIIIRDITGDSHDDGGKPIPFLMSFISDELADVRKMDRLFAYIIQNTETVKKSLGGMMHYDAKYNGLCFELGEINKWLNSVLENKKDSGVRLTSGSYDSVNCAGVGNSYLILPQGFDSNHAIEELGLDIEKTKSYKYYHVIPEDNKQNADAYLELWNAEQEQLRKEKFKKYGIIAAIAIIVLTIILIISLSGRHTQENQEIPAQEVPDISCIDCNCCRSCANYNYHVVRFS